MTRESEAVTWLLGDGAITALFTGGIRGYRAVWSTREGFTRALYASAFDASGFLKPMLIVKERGEIPRGDLYDEAERVESTNQILEIQMYEDAGYSSIEAGKPLIIARLQGHQFSRGYPARLVFETVPLQDNGTIKGASMQRLDFQIVGLLSA